MIFQSLQGSGLRNRYVTEQGWSPRDDACNQWYDSCSVDTSRCMDYFRGKI